MPDVPAKVEETDARMLIRTQLTPDQLVGRLDLIKETMRKAMVQKVDYGVIPGCRKPSLLQPGAEKLCALFQLAPTYEFEKEWRPELEHPWEKRDAKGNIRKGICKGFIRYECECRAIHGPTGTLVSGGTGTANNWEPKFVSRDPYEVEETIKQFARKRAMINTVRTGTAASAIFTQDMEDQPGASDQSAGAPPPPAPQPAPPTPPPPPPSGDSTPLVGFGKHREKHWSEVPSGYLQWLVDNIDTSPGADKGGYGAARVGKAKDELDRRAATAEQSAQYEPDTDIPF